ncbi:MAG: cellulose synthase family protein, partial [Acidobacteriota bacterium]
MTSISLGLEIAYYSVLSLLALYGLHRFCLVVIYLRRRRTFTTLRDSGGNLEPVVWPRVTVQLPIFNEFYVIERLIASACSLQYPAGRLEIQVLDDSTDATRELAGRLVKEYRGRGHDIHHLHRSHRRGYKAGALADGLARARGELIAIFDADFIVPPDFLLRTVPRFLDACTGAGLGMVQARWGHANRDQSLLTRMQALLLDGHFVIEHGARYLSGRFFNFNGTAGIFRRRCIEDAGGWQADTLTEDLDLSYRAQLAGWRFEYMPDLVVPAELPVEINSLKSQQRRWARGSVQTARKLLPRMLAAPVHPLIRLEAAIHLTNNVAYVLMCLLAILIVPAFLVRSDDTTAYLLLDLPLFLAGTASYALFCGVAQRATRSDWAKTLLAIPAMMALGIGLSLNNGLAVLSAFGRRSTEFQRTPKYRLGRDRASCRDWKRLSYRGPRSALILLEGAFVVYFTSAIVAEVLE